MRGIDDGLWWLANDESCLRHQAFWHSWQGPLLEEQQSNNITLIDVLESVHAFLEGHLDDFEIPEAFVTKELPHSCVNVSAPSATSVDEPLIRR